MIFFTCRRRFNLSLRTIFLFVLLFLFYNRGAFAQTVSSYNFSETVSSFSGITGTSGLSTDFTAGDDAVTGVITIPFTFTYNGIAYTSCKISTNGFLTLGSATTPANAVYTPISTNTAAYNTAVSAFGSDLVSTVQHNTIGTAPNRVFVVEWSDAYRYNIGTAENLNFQIRLSETSNLVEVVFGAVTSPNLNFTASTAETGLKGGTADFNSVSFTNPTLTGYTYTNDWKSLIQADLQTDKVGITASVYPASGLTLRWTPAVCTQPTVSSSVTAVTNFSATVSWTNSAAYAAGYYVRWRRVDQPYSFPTWSSPVPVSAGLSTYNITGLTATAYYIFSVEGRCSGASRSNSSTVTTANTTNGKGLFRTAGCSAVPALLQVGPTSPYINLQAALTVLNSCPITQPTVVELQSNYNPLSETFPLLITGNPGASATNTITIRPAAGAGPFSFIGTGTQDFLILRGAKYYRIDGRPGGTGTNQNISITTTGGSSAVRLSDDAQYNMIRYLNLATSVSGTDLGVVQISGTYGTGLANGNNNNTISNCNINGGGKSPCGVYEKGSAAPADNKSNTVSNNNIFDYYRDYSFSVPNAGVALMNSSEGRTPGYDWTISGNSMFSTTSSLNYLSDAGWYGIYYEEPYTLTHNISFKITGNYIGGTAPLCGGTALNINQQSTFSRGTRGIHVTDGYTGNSVIQGNTITNFSVSAKSQYAGFFGIDLSSGNAVIDGNLIGNLTSPGAVSVYSSATSNYVFSVGISASNNVTGFASPVIRNNKVAGFYADGSYGVIMRCINTQYGVGPDNLSYTVTNNQVGTAASPVTNQSPGGNIFGISTMGTAGAVISGNTVMNLNITNTASDGDIFGIEADYGPQTIGSYGGGNTVYNLNNNSAGGVIYGIIQRGTGAVSSIAYNRIYALHSNSTAVTDIMGIAGTGPGRVTANNNYIYGSDAAPAGSGSSLYGLYLSADTSLAYNNVVSLGTVSPTVPLQIYGIYERANKKSEIYFNSVYIGGNNVTGGIANSYAYKSTSSLHIVKNNIFSNVRSNGSSTGKHYAFSVTSVAPANILDNNLYYAPGTGGFLGNYNTTNYNLMSQIRTFTGFNTASISADPNYIDPAAATPDLSINQLLPSVVESGAQVINGITADYNGAIRSVYTPDIGAYEIPATRSVPVIGNISVPSPGCNATAHNISVTVTPGVTPVNAGMVTLNYSFNGTAQTPITMTNAGGNTWTATIPAATPANATVTFNVAADDGNFLITKAGTSYNDASASLLTVAATATPAVICSGNSSVLKLDVNGAANVSLGTGAVTLGTITTAEALSPLSQYYESQHSQYLVLASDLTAAGLRTGNLSSLSFNVTTKNSTKPFTNYTIKLGATAITSLTNGNNSSFFYTVYRSSATGGTGYTSTAGVNSFPFGTGAGTVSAFPWDGTSNILVDICFENDPLAGGTYYSNVDVVRATTKTYTAVYGYYEDNASLCGAVNGNTSSSNRLPDFSFYGSNAVLNPSGYSWSDGATTVGTTNNLSVSPTATTTYTGTVTVAGCTAVSNPVTVTVNAVSVSAGPASVAKCPGLNTSFSVTAAGGATGYQWQVSTNGGGAWSNLSNNALYSGVTTATLSLTGISAGLNNYYYRVIVNGCGPVVTSSAAILTVYAPPVISITPAAPAFCAGSSSPVNLTASGASTYTWSPSATLTAASGTTVGASPAATTTYTVTGTDVNSCSNTATYSLGVLQSPRIASVNGPAAAICAGSSTVLSVNASAPNIAALPNAYSFAQSAGSYSPISGSILPNGTGDDVGNGNLPIGFNFYYNNTAHTVFSAGSNGLLILSDPTVSYTLGYPYDNGLATTPLVIAPFWDDNNTTGGNIQYLTTGTAPNRVLTVQWTGMHTGGNGSATSATMSCQAQLFESTNVIRFIYGTPSTLFNFVTASVGISGSTGNFLSVTPGSPATVSSVTENKTISASIPAGTIYTFTPPAATLTYAWSPSSGLTPNASAATVTTPTLSVPATYNVTVNNGSCTATGSVNIVVKPGNTWLGVNSNWFDAQNWCPGVPGPATDVIIPNGAANYPIISSFAPGYATVRNISIQTGASVVVSGSGRFSVAGAVSNSGTFDLSDGSLVLSGSSQNLLPNSISNSVVKNLFVNAPSGSTNFVDNAGGRLRIKDSLSFFGSNNTLQSNASIVLVSDATHTASLTDLTANGTLSGNSVTGDVIVERYLKAGRKWRFLSVPTGTQQSIKNAWMENNTPGNNTGAAGYGTWITDPAGTANGFDAASSTPSMKRWNGTTYIGVSSASSALLTTKGYMIYVRGDRSVPNTGSSTTSTTLRTSGSLFQGNYPASGFSIPAGGALTDIGNIYASAIDLSRMNWGSAATPVQVFVWDPFLGTGSSYGLGAFQTLTRIAGQNDFVITPGGGSYVGVNSGDVMNKIESGQAFFVQGGAVPNSLQFRETAKGIGERLVSFTANQPQNLFGRLYFETGGAYNLTDGFAVMMNENQSRAHTNDDAIKQPNTGENVSVKQDDALHAVDLRSLLNQYDTIFISMSNMHISNYRWEMDARNLDKPGRDGFLVDRFTNTLTSLDLAGVTPYAFSVTGDAGSSAADRFMIVFRPSTVLALSDSTPIRLLPDLSRRKIMIYPNPVENKLMQVRFIKAEKGKYRLTVADAAGRMIKNTEIIIGSSRQTVAVDLHTAAAGTYFVQVQKEDMQLLREKVVLF